MSIPDILAVAIIGKKNDPLFVRGYTKRDLQEPDSQIAWHFIFHACLDVFDERGRAEQALISSNKNGDSYLGLLRIANESTLYGYQTNTGIKFMLAFSLTDALVRDHDVKAVFRAIHNAYIGYLSNPFSEGSLVSSDRPIRSAKFAQRIDHIARKGA